MTNHPGGDGDQCQKARTHSIPAESPRNACIAPSSSAFPHFAFLRENTPNAARYGVDWKAKSNARGTGAHLTSVAQAVPHKVRLPCLRFASYWLSSSAPRRVVNRCASGSEVCLPKIERPSGGDIDLVQWAWPLGRPWVAHVRSDIWEVRSSLANREARVLFALAGREMVLLHGFVKKTRNTPSEDLDIAERRWKAWEGREQGEEDE